MKKVFSKFFATMTICCISALLITCKDDDDDCRNCNNDFINNTTIEGLTYVFNGEYDGKSAELVNRVVNKASSAYENGLANIIIKSESSDSAFGIANLIPMAMLFSRGGNIVICEPDLNTMKQMAETVKSVLDLYKSNTENRQTLLPDTTSNSNSKLSIEKLMQFANSIDMSFMDNMEGKITFVGIRKNSLYCLTEINENNVKSIIADYKKSEITGNDSIFSLVMENEATKADYANGNELGRITQWLNE